MLDVCRVSKIFLKSLRPPPRPPTYETSPQWNFKIKGSILKIKKPSRLIEKNSNVKFWCSHFRLSIWESVMDWLLGWLIETYLSPWSSSSENFGMKKQLCGSFDSFGFSLSLSVPAQLSYFRFLVAVICGWKNTFQMLSIQLVPCRNSAALWPKVYVWWTQQCFRWNCRSAANTAGKPVGLR